MFKSSKIIVILLCFSFMQAAYSDEQAYQVTGKAWKAFNQKNWDEVVKLANTSLKRWGAKAKETNKSLTALPQGEEAKGYANLNEVGTILWLKGEALRNQGKKAEAKKAYQLLISDYNYAQAWDNKGWFWQPS